ncbi:hypothetical protein MHM582_0405 [Microbacterium sp. HM58-2]|nr:hypothetical protein MHM582_0405 [Microbacterium sp. HM58-2]
MTTTATAAPQIADGVAATLDRIFAVIDGWRDSLHEALADPSARTAERTDPITHRLVLPALEDGLITGAGFVAAPGLLSDAEWHLAWWLADAAASGPRRLATVSDPSSDMFRDHTALEWWRVPARTHARHLTGPYVDYVCTDDYTVTITSPVIEDGEMLGVVGVDCLVDRLERELRPPIVAHGGAAIVNASSRVVTATDARLETGAILRLDGLADALAPLREAQPGAVDIALPGDVRVLSCGDTSLALVTGL